MRDVTFHYIASWWNGT